MSSLVMAFQAVVSSRAMVKARRLASFAWALTVGLFGLSRASWAEGFQADGFQPPPAGDRFFGVENPESLGDFAWDFSLAMSLDVAPAKVTAAGERVAIVGAQMVEHFGAAVTIEDRLKLSLDIPWGFVSTASEPTPNATYAWDAAFGDVRVGTRLLVGGRPGDEFLVAVSGAVDLPTGSQGAYFSDGALRGGPSLVLGGRVDEATWALTSGVMFRPVRTFYDVELGDVWENRLALGYALTYSGAVMLEAWNGVVTQGANSFAGNTTRVEVALGWRQRVSDFLVGPAVAFGASGGVGTPVARGVLSIAYAPLDRDGFDLDFGGDDEPIETPPMPPVESHGDADHDGIPDESDACYLQAGIPTDEPITHGCPDTDGDSIVDFRDACARVPGPRSDKPHENGCPRLDRDGDGIFDDDDACPGEPGSQSEYPYDNGCPPDTDSDGILDSEDACPTIKGPPRLEPALNGCPKTEKKDDD